MIANVDALGTVPVVFVVMMAIIILLGVRSWAGVMRVTLTRLVARLLDGSIVTMSVLFLILVVIRFGTLS